MNDVRVWIGLSLFATPALAQAGVCDVADVGGGGCEAGDCCYYVDEVSVCAPGGAGVQDATCVVSNDCACGHVCIGGAGAGVCARWCGGDTPDDAACAGTARCTISLPSASGGTLGYVCETPDLCDPIAQDCADGEACYVIDPDGTTTCSPAGEGAAHATCAYQNDCARGLSCVGDVCATFCDPTAPDVCGEEPCTETPWTIPGTEDPIGYCGDFGDDPNASGGDEDGGCGCRTNGAPGVFAAIATLAVLAIARRRRS